MSSHSSARAVWRHQDPAEFAYLLLYMPWGLAWFAAPSPLVSYGIAWAGSLFILWVSTTGRIKHVPDDRPISGQVLRPLFLMQGLFAGYFCLTSIFYVWEFVNGGGTYSELGRIAAAQRYYVLGHAAFVTGLLTTMDYRNSGEWQFRTSMSRSQLTLSLGIGALVFAQVLSQLPGLGQFVVKLRGIAPVAIILSAALAIRDSEWLIGILGFGLYSYVLVRAFLSGWKESIVAAIGLFVIYLYQEYQRTALALGAVMIILTVAIVPAYNSIYRNLHWGKQISEERAAQIASARVLSGDIDLQRQGWKFLSGRSTQIDMFAQYIEHTPQKHPYYGLSIIKRAVLLVTPEVLWPEKPDVEQVAMQRVYENGVVSRLSSASAKPQVVADGYLSGGALGVFLTCLILGFIGSWGSRAAEKWLGGYLVGGQVVYVVLFNGIVRTASFEFLVSDLFWSFVLMGVLFVSLYIVGLLQLRPAPSKPPSTSRSVFFRRPN